MTYCKTTYRILDVEGNCTEIRLDKCVADTLQDRWPNVHQWIERCFRNISMQYPYYTRRRKGDQVRKLATQEAEKFPEYFQRMISTI